SSESAGMGASDWGFGWWKGCYSAARRQGRFFCGYRRALCPRTKRRRFGCALMESANHKGADTMKVFKPLLLASAVALCFSSTSLLADSPDGLERVQVDLVAPPLVHPHEQATAAKPRVVQFRMTIEEKKMVI